ncbi:g13337 [Coccomyxa viridis]|uniref:G13337 protein n=1 Tax=Coccomyxa viridis TaxID=1274662 RepID=A0ABP1GF63_9CHLO
MRLCRPNLPSDGLLHADFSNDFVPDEIALSEHQNEVLEQDTSCRAHAAEPADVIALDGMLELPQAFGSINLGETFATFISVGNYSDTSVAGVIVKAELQSSRQKVSLYDNSATPLHLDPGERHDFMVKHDIKEISAYTLVCSSSYSTADGVAYQPQYFKFNAANPLSVRTKMRTLDQRVLLEACIENATSKPLQLAQVKFETAPSIKAEPIHHSASSSRDVEDLRQPDIWLESYADGLQDVEPGGSANYLFMLTAEQQAGSQAPQKGLTGALGKLEVRWRSSSAALGRLQTQQITASSAAQKDVALTLCSLPQEVCLEQPFTAQLRVHNASSAPADSLALSLPAEEIPGFGMHLMGVPGEVLGELSPTQNQMVQCGFLPLHGGLVRFPLLQLMSSTSGKILDVLAEDTYVTAGGV